MKASDGIFPGIMRAEYDGIDAINFSRLKHLARSPAHFRYACDHPAEPSEAMLLGTLVHCAVLEPSQFDRRYIVAPKVDRRTLSGKAAWAEFQELAAGKTVVSADHVATALSIAGALERSETARLLLHGRGLNEVGVTWADQQSGLRCKALIDRITTYAGETVVIDLKTTQDAGEWAFGQAAARYHYDAQAAWYLAGLHAHVPMRRRFVFIAVETEPPYCHAVLEIDPVDAAAAFLRCRHWLDTYAGCLIAGNWPGYGEGIHTLNIPKWRNEE